MKYYQYGKIAVRALQLLEICECAEDAWYNAAMEIYGKESIAKKPCPKNTFLGIVEGKTSKNAEYAYQAIEIINRMSEEELSSIEPGTFWNQKMLGVPNKHNGQIDVVFALKEKGFI